MQTKPNTQITLKIDWADLDLFGHVNNVAFFRYLQSARVNYCELIGLSSISELEPSFMVVSSQCNFKRSLHYPGEIKVYTNSLWIKNTSVGLQHLVFDQNNELCAQGEDVLVMYDHAAGHKMPVSEKVRALISSIDGKSNLLIN